MKRKALLSFCTGALLCAFIAAQPFFEREWEKNYSTEKQTEIIQCMDVGDLDGNGTPEIVVGLSIRPQAGLQEYAVQVLDRSGNKKYRWDSSYPVNDVAIADIDDDGVAEILVSGADFYVLSNKAQNLNYTPIGTVVFTAQAKDLDEDGKTELLVGTRNIVCRGDVLNWEVPIGTQIKKIIVSDLSWDGEPEIVVLTAQNVYVLDRNGAKLWISPGTQDLRDVAVADIDGDRNKEILFSTDNQLILVWEAKEDGLEREIDLKSYTADLLAVEDVNRDGSFEIVVASSKLRLEILDVEGDTLWQYKVEPIESQDFFADMILSDMDGDNWVDIMLTHSVNAMTGVVDSLLYFMKNQLGIPPPIKGTEYFGSAVEFYDKGDCERAVDLFGQAQTLFLEEGNQEMADQCQDYIDLCEERLAKLADADAKFSEAETLFQQGDYEKAASLYEEAQTLYQELGDSEKAQACSDRLTEIATMQVPEEELPEEPERSGLGLLLLIAVAAVLGGVVYFFMKRSRGKVKGKIEKKEKPPEEIAPPEEAAPSVKVREEERKLKSQFVYGEISREEYEEKLRNLYEGES